MQEWVIELIETLWNVNYVAKTHSIETKYELIETLWNVNHNHVCQL